MWSSSLTFSKTTFAVIPAGTSTSVVRIRYIYESNTVVTKHSFDLPKYLDEVRNVEAY